MARTESDFYISVTKQAAPDPFSGGLSLWLGQGRVSFHTFNLKQRTTAKGHYLPEDDLIFKLTHT